MNAPQDQAPEIHHIRTLSTLLLVAFLIVGLALFFWGVVRASSILAREDNPRLVEAELSIQRGSILDRAGNILAQNLGTGASQRRFYPYPRIGPAVGYYSFTYGTAGAENAFDAVLRGGIAGDSTRYWQELLHQPQQGFDVRLALDLAMQNRAQSLMGDSSGAVLLLELPHSERDRAWIRVMHSFPGYDPNRIDDEYETLDSGDQTSLLNRVTQGQYQPGLLLQPLILASALEQGLVQLGARTVEDAGRPVAVNGVTLSCAEVPPEPATWEEVLRQQCPAPMLDLADRLGPGGLDAAFAAFGLDRDPQLEIDTTTVPDASVKDPLSAALGQENLSVTPLQIGLAMSALVGDGLLPQAQLAEALMDENRVWHDLTAQTEAISSITPQTAQRLRQALPKTGDISELSTLVVSGPEGGTDTWYMGLSAGPTANYVAVVMLEGSHDRQAARQIGRELISATR